MPSVIETIHENSERFVPAFALVAAQLKRTDYRCRELDMIYRGGSPTSLNGAGASPRAMPPNEQELGRWVTGGGCLFLVSDEGKPVQRNGDSASGNQLRLFGGYAELVLTNRRLLGAVFDAETVFGRLTRSGAEGVLLFTLDLDRIESVVANLKKGLLGGTKEQYVSISNITSTSAFTLTVEDIVAGGRMLDKLVDATAQRRHEGPIGRRLETTSPAEVFHRTATGQRVTITFVGDHF